MKDVAAIILAAGQSKRMGAFKPLLPFGDRTVIETCIDYLRTGGIRTVIVVLGQGPHAADLREHLKHSGVIFAINPDSASAMTASIACGLREIPETARAVVITPADHPAVPGNVVKMLIDEWQQGARLVMPANSGRGGHPVLISLTFRDELLDLDRGRGLKAFFDTHQEQLSRVAVDSHYIARDMDTWDDYLALHQEVFGVSPREVPSRKQE